MKKIGVVLFVCTLVILIINTAPPQYPVINHSFDCIDCKGSTFGQHDGEIFGIGWFDEAAYKFERFPNLASYRNYVGPINIIRTNCWSLTKHSLPTYYSWDLTENNQIYFFLKLLTLEEVQGIKKASTKGIVNFEDSLLNAILNQMNYIDSSLYFTIIGWYTLDEPVCHVDTHPRYLSPKDFMTYNRIIRDAEKTLGIEKKIIIFNPYSLERDSIGNLVNFI